MIKFARISSAFKSSREFAKLMAINLFVGFKEVFATIVKDQSSECDNLFAFDFDSLGQIESTPTMARTLAAIL